MKDRKINVTLFLSVAAMLLATGSTYYSKTVATDGVPIGTILAFANNGVPSTTTSYYPCDGSLLSRTTYWQLFDVIGTRFGSGDGSTTFAIPDLRGRFIRGVDVGTQSPYIPSGRDPDSASRTANASGGLTGNTVGSVQEDQFASHRHTGRGRTFDTGYPVSSSFGLATDSNLGINANPGPVGGSRVRPTTDAFDFSGGNETRPKNMNVLFMIKVAAE